MPYEIQHIGGKAHQHKSQKADTQRLIPQGNFPVGYIKGDQKENRHAAVDIRPVIQPRFHSHVHTMPCQHIDGGKIKGQLGREIDIAEFGQMQRRILRNEQNGGHSSCQSGK